MNFQNQKLPQALSARDKKGIVILYYMLLDNNHALLRNNLSLEVKQKISSVLLVMVVESFQFLTEKSVVHLV